MTVERRFGRRPVQIIDHYVDPLRDLAERADQIGPCETDHRVSPNS
jgi:hypothetical protein